MQTARLWFEVTFDEAVTDAETLANEFEHILNLALTPTGWSDEVGNPDIGKIRVCE